MINYNYQLIPLNKEIELTGDSMKMIGLQTLKTLFRPDHKGYDMEICFSDSDYNTYYRSPVNTVYKCNSICGSKDFYGNVFKDGGTRAIVMRLTNLVASEALKVIKK